MGVPLADARVGAFRTALRCGANALPLRACSMPLTQMTCAIMSLPCLILKYNHLQAKTLHNTQRGGFFRDSLREACEGRASARCRAKRSTEAIA
ncbi:MAG: hypothetical protein NZ455_12345 [Bacteroidia bacterium]|nr:hypothetical protein [Bacteroidia bacterium]